MRVIAGTLGGRTFTAPSGPLTHPMGDKIRGALFNVLGDIKGLSVLDAFSGSGAVAIEAISRGARHAVAVEVDKGAHRCITANIRSLGLGNHIKAIRANVSTWSDNNAQQQFDIVVCDPPYQQLQEALLAKLMRHVVPGGLFILSVPPDFNFLAGHELTLLSHKSYGDATLVFYRRLA